MFEELIDCMPVLNADGEIVDVLFWHDVFTEKVEENRPKIDLPVVIMAGGKGTRLKPITNVIPKPLVPVGDKTILEVIMDQFEGIGWSSTSANLPTSTTSSSLWRINLSELSVAFRS